MSDARRAAAKMAPLGRGAKVIDQTAPALLEACRTARRGVVDALDFRCLLRGVPRVPLGQENSRSTTVRCAPLSARRALASGASSIHLRGAAGETATIESTKLRLKRASQNLEVAQDRFANPARRENGRPERHDPPRRDDELVARCAPSRGPLAHDDGHRLMAARNDPLTRGDEHRQWRWWHLDVAQEWRLAISGDRESRGKNSPIGIIRPPKVAGDAVAWCMALCAMKRSPGDKALRGAVQR